MADGGQAIDQAHVIELAARRLARALGYGGGFLADTREEAERNAESTCGIGHLSVVKRGRVIEQAAKSIHESTRVRRQHEWKQSAGVIAIPVARPDQDALAALSFAKLDGPLEAILLLYATGDVPKYWPIVKRFGLAVKAVRFAEEALTDAMQRILCGRAVMAQDMRAKALNIRASRYRRLTSACEDLLRSWLKRASHRYLLAVT
ncbi:hypothetical protein RKE25_09905 [Dyella sp. BiH032]|uniref:hypothetical protein n=1 Tax=Dyella sp. BiH032 TaxID=3075430 RepID=UPI0028934E22|nr:hypothetical protein [Dyella sp. BiH032]WNL47913.1 hypothetical protein RKE25_09905 [Dyella sp. BiH032]